MMSHQTVALARFAKRTLPLKELSQWPGAGTPAALLLAQSSRVTCPKHTGKGFSVSCTLALDFLLLVPILATASLLVPLQEGLVASLLGVWSAVSPLRIAWAAVLPDPKSCPSGGAHILRLPEASGAV